MPDTVIGAQGGALTLYGRPYRFVGVNAYEIATKWGTNAGCGGMETQAQLDQLFSILPRDSLVRFWAFQGSMATDVHTGRLEWGPLDRVFAAAAAHGQRLIVTVTDQGGTCDGGHWQDPAWYQGGFRQVYDGATDGDGVGLDRLSYWDYLQLLVARYRRSPALGMWEPVSEPEASTCAPQFEPTSCSGHQSCPDEAMAAAALRQFFDVVGAEIHALDPEHVVESGTLGGGQCGTQGADYQAVGASSGIDVLSVHDYYGTAPMGGDRWNGIAVRVAQAAALGKPLVTGEAGIEAGAGAGCMPLTARAADMGTKLHAQLAAGISGFLVWDWVPQPTTACNFDTYPGDPLMSLVAAGVAPT